MRAAIYARVSTGEQAEQELSIPDQITRCKAYCRDNGMEIAVTYVDCGYSATTDNRPDFQRMLSDAAHTPPPYDVILVHAQSRFARNLTDLLVIERQLERRGVKLISITQDFGDSDTALMMRVVTGMMDEHHSRETSKHVRRAMAENARQGFWCGSEPPFGYESYTAETRGKKEKKKLKIVPSEAEVVRRIFDLYTKGEAQSGPLGINTIAARFNAEGVTRRGHGFSKQTIAKILRNESYTGTYVYGRRSGKPQEEWIEFPIPQIVDQMTFDAVQDRIERQHPFKTAPRRTNNPVLLSGLAVCDACGKPLRIATGKSGAYRYYKCGTRLDQGQARCSGCSIPEAQLDEAVIEALCDRVLNPDRMRQVIPQLIDRVRKSSGEAEQRIRALKNQRAGLKQKQNRLLTLIEDGKLEIDEPVSEKLSGHRSEIQRLDGQIARLESTAEAPLEPISGEEAVRFAEKLKARISSAERAAFRKAYVQLVIDEVRLAPEAITIKGSNHALSTAAIADQRGNDPVLTSAQDWCRMPDSNQRPPHYE